MKQLTSFVDDVLIDLLHLTGCTDDHEYIDQELAKLEARTQTLAKLSLDLNDAVGQKILSVDYEVTAIHADADYDESIMDSADDQERLVARVLATVKLGLERLRKHEGNGGKARWDHVIVMRPVVELDPLVASMGSSTGTGSHETESLGSV
jgi:hypothetical protein